MTPLLDIRDLRLYYAAPRGPVRAVDGISLRLEGPGQALGLVGESGSGKTSLASALMRMLPRNVACFEGEIYLQGQEVAHLPEEAFRRTVRWQKIALVPQGAMNAFNPVLRVGEQVIEPMLTADGASRREAIREGEKLLERVGLPREVFRRYPHELSGGMKQRVMIAAALIMHPPLLLMDEPTSALDVSVQAQITNLLKQLKWELGLSLIFITHDIAVASDVCDMLAVIYAGEIAEQGTADQVLTPPAHPYTQKLLASVPRLHVTRPPEFIPGEPPDLSAPPSGCRFHPRCPYASERCVREQPPLFFPHETHAVRCWLLVRWAGGR
ncbi:MAG TPA: ABC transporter ATP-binding protein [Anaerolineae bacterium]|nr:ABC transporter ATP-binding protein [Anaerolineae bacterium]